MLIVSKRSNRFDIPTDSFFEKEKSFETRNNKKNRFSGIHFLLENRIGITYIKNSDSSSEKSGVFHSSVWRKSSTLFRHQLRIVSIAQFFPVKAAECLSRYLRLLYLLLIIIVHSLILFSAWIKYTLVFGSYIVLWPCDWTRYAKVLYSETLTYHNGNIFVPHSSPT